MINVDISNIWCSASLPQLLELEKEVFDAHCAFRKDSKDLGNRLGWLCLPEHLEQEELERVQQAAAEIRAASSALVIVGQQQACDCSRGVVELLCGTQPDLRPGQTKLIYCPDSLSSRAFQDLMGKLEEIEFSVLVIAGAEMRLQTAVLLRSLRWMRHGCLHRKGQRADLCCDRADQRDAVPSGRRGELDEIRFGKNCRQPV